MTFNNSIVISGNGAFVNLRLVYSFGTRVNFLDSKFSS